MQADTDVGFSVNDVAVEFLNGPVRQNAANRIAIRGLIPVLEKQAGVLDNPTLGIAGGGLMPYSVPWGNSREASWTSISLPCLRARSAGSPPPGQ
jgi:hypothetical protein